MLVKEKVAQAVEILREKGIDCWITFTRESQINGDPALDFLSSSYVTWHSAFVITATGEAHAVVGLYDVQTMEDTGAYDSVTGFVEGVREPFLELMRKLDPETIGINYSQGSEICDGLTHGMYLFLHEMLSELGFESRLISAEPVVSALRERKSAGELELISQAIGQTEEIFAAVTEFIRPGRTEKEIAAFMKAEVKCRDLGYAWGEESCPAVFTGPDTAGAHYGPTDRKVEPGHLLNMDFGVKVGGYCSDMQRTFYVLEPAERVAPPEVQQGFATIVNAIESSRAALRPGVLGHEIDAVARAIVVEGGYEEFPHGLGHQVGRYSHDGTALLGPAWEKYAQKPFKEIEEGMVFTIEPRLTVPGRGVATIEEMVVVRGEGAKFLSRPQTELILIG